MKYHSRVQQTSSSPQPDMDISSSQASDGLGGTNNEGYAAMDNFELIASATALALSGDELCLTTHSMTGALAVATNDYDWDGWNNLLQYGLGDPTNTVVTVTAPVLGQIAQVGGTNWIDYIHLPRTNANHGITCTLEQTADLTVTWSNRKNAVVTGTGPADYSAFMTVTNRIPIDGKTQKFIRLRIDQ